MEIDIKKENFTVDNFDPKILLNNLLNNNADSESEIIKFKLKILQREFLNEIDLNTNNLLKFTKILENDIQATNTSNYVSLQNVKDMMKNKIESKRLEDLEKAFKIRGRNKNLQDAMVYLESENY
jgi:membrane-associated HD superfamily phosphohydrolase